MKLAIAALAAQLALAAAAPQVQTQTFGPTIADCTTRDNLCRTGNNNNNLSTCNSSLTRCRSCQAIYSRCRTARGANQIACAASVINCVSDTYAWLFRPASTSRARLRATPRRVSAISDGPSAVDSASTTSATDPVTDPATTTSPAPLAVRQGGRVAPIRSPGFPGFPGGRPVPNNPGNNNPGIIVGGLRPTTSAIRGDNGGGRRGGAARPSPAGRSSITAVPSFFRGPAAAPTGSDIRDRRSSATSPPLSTSSEARGDRGGPRRGRDPRPRPSDARSSESDLHTDAPSSSSTRRPQGRRSTPSSTASPAIRSFTPFPIIRSDSRGVSPPSSSTTTLVRSDVPLPTTTSTRSEVRSERPSSPSRGSTPLSTVSDRRTSSRATAPSGPSPTRISSAPAPPSRSDSRGSDATSTGPPFTRIGVPVTRST